RRRAVVRLRPGQRLRDRSTIGARRPPSRASVRWWQPSSEVTGGGPTRRAGAGRHDSHAPAQGRRAHPPRCPPRRHRPQQSRPAAAPLRRGAGRCSAPLRTAADRAPVYVPSPLTGGCSRPALVCPPPAVPALPILAGSDGARTAPDRTPSTRIGPTAGAGPTPIVGLVRNAVRSSG